MEQVIQNFLWKGKIDQIYIIQVSWKWVFQPKKCEGLGLKDLTEWNNAKFGKLVSDFYKDKLSFW